MIQILYKELSLAKLPYEFYVCSPLKINKFLFQEIAEANSQGSSPWEIGGKGQLLCHGVEEAALQGRVSPLGPSRWEQRVPALSLQHARTASKLQWPRVFISIMPTFLEPDYSRCTRTPWLHPPFPQRRSGWAQGRLVPTGVLRCSTAFCQSSSAWPLPWKHCCRFFYLLIAKCN